MTHLYIRCNLQSSQDALGSPVVAAALDELSEQTNALVRLSMRPNNTKLETTDAMY